MTSSCGCCKEISTSLTTQWTHCLHHSSSESNRNTTISNSTLHVQVTLGVDGHGTTCNVHMLVD